MAHEVFISYSLKDKESANKVCDVLEGKGIKCWIAPRDVAPGAKYARAIISALASSRLVVLVFSSHTNQSEHVESEIDYAYNKHIPIITLRLEDAALSQSLEYYLSKSQWFDALTPPLEKHVNVLSESVRLFLQKVPDAAITLSSPPAHFKKSEEADSTTHVIPPTALNFLSLHRVAFLLTFTVLAVVLGVVFVKLKTKPPENNNTSTPVTNAKPAPGVDTTAPKKYSESESRQGSASSIIPRSKYAIPAENRRIKEIIIHETVTESLAEAIEHQKSLRMKYAYHYLIDKNGAKRILIEERAVPWHTPQHNDESIAIGLVHMPRSQTKAKPGDVPGEDSYPKAQIQALLTLLVEVSNRYDLDPLKILSYQEAREDANWEMDITRRMKEIRQFVFNERK